MGDPYSKNQGEGSWGVKPEDDLCAPNASAHLYTHPHAVRCIHKPTHINTKCILLSIDNKSISTSSIITNHSSVVCSLVVPMLANAESGAISNRNLQIQQAARKSFHTKLPECKKGWEGWDQGKPHSVSLLKSPEGWQQKMLRGRHWFPSTCGPDGAKNADASPLSIMFLSPGKLATQSVT